MTILTAFHNKEEIKTKYLERVKAHENADLQTKIGNCIEEDIMKS